jgi:hypothetical protein
VARLSGRQQLVDLSNGVQDLIDTIEAGDLEAMDPYERLDLWQYLQGVANRLALVERAMGWEEPEPYSGGLQAQSGGHLGPETGQAGPGARGPGRAASRSRAAGGPPGST